PAHLRSRSGRPRRVPGGTPPTARPGAPSAARRPEVPAQPPTAPARAGGRRGARRRAARRRGAGAGAIVAAGARAARPDENWPLGGLGGGKIKMKGGPVGPGGGRRPERGGQKLDPVMPAPPQPGSAAGAAQPKPDAAWVAALALVEPLCRGRDVLLIEGGSG